MPNNHRPTIVRENVHVLEYLSINVSVQIMDDHLQFIKQPIYHALDGLRLRRINDDAKTLIHCLYLTINKNEFSRFLT